MQILNIRKETVNLEGNNQMKPKINSVENDYSKGKQ